MSIIEFQPEKHYLQRARDTSKGTCRRKKAYKTASLASLASARVSKRNGTLTVSYECKFCGFFHLTKANSEQGITSMTLPTTFKDMEVFHDNQGPYIKVDIVCEKCNQTEQGIRRLSVVEEVYTRPQGIIPLDPSNIIHPKAGSKKWVHKVCPSLEIPNEEQTSEKEVDKAPASQSHAPYMLEISFDIMTVIELAALLHPSNPVSDGVARGAAWTFVKDIAEKMLKK